MDRWSKKFRHSPVLLRNGTRREPRDRARAAFQDLRELKVDVAYPLLLELYDDYAGDAPEEGRASSCSRLIEAYVFRRAICSIPTNSMNKTFSTFRRSLKKDNYLESVKATFLLLPSYRRFPTDEEFMREFKVRDLYNFRSRSYWLRRIENDGRKERVPVDEYTIEHIMPQNEDLSAAWRADLGADWHRIHDAKLHTVGNLTLTGYNSEYSDRPFAEKRDMEGVSRHSPLRLNEGLAIVETLERGSDRKRAERLAKSAGPLWQRHELKPEVLNGYRSKPEKGDHRVLHRLTIRSLQKERRHALYSTSFGRRSSTSTPV